MGPDYSDYLKEEAERIAKADAEYKQREIERQKAEYREAQIEQKEAEKRAPPPPTPPPPSRPPTPEEREFFKFFLMLFPAAPFALFVCIPVFRSQLPWWAITGLFVLVLCAIGFVFYKLLNALLAFLRANWRVVLITLAVGLLGYLYSTQPDSFLTSLATRAAVIVCGLWGIGEIHARLVPKSKILAALISGVLGLMLVLGNCVVVQRTAPSAPQSK